MITDLPAGKVILTWEPLEIAIRLYLYELLKQFIAIDTTVVYALVSYLAGAIFIFFAILTANLLGKNKFEKVFVFSILISMGSILLFLGYAENYSLSYVNMLAYFYFSLRYLKGKSNVLPVTITFIIGCLLHLLTFYLSPSLIFLYLLKPDSRTEKLHFSRKRVFLILPLVLLIVVGIYAYIITYSNTLFLSGISVPLSPTWYGMPYYTLFSSSHILDILNEHLLVSPVGLILLIAVVVAFGLKKMGLKDRIFQFLIIVIVFQLAFHFLIDPKLGAARDWDLFSFAALGYTLLGIYLFLKLVQDKQQIRYIGTVLIFTSLLSTLPWVMINASTGRSVKRIVNIVRVDPARNFWFYIYVEEYLEKIGWLGREENKKMNELFRITFPLAWLNRKAEKELKAGNLKAAEAIYKETVRIAPWRQSTHYNLGTFHLRVGKIDSAISEFEKAIQLNPKDALAFSSYAGLGHIYLRKKQFGKAIEMYREAMKGEVENKEGMYQNLGHCYLLTNRLDEAILAYQKALKLNPNFTQPHLYLGHAYLKKGMKNEAIKEYKIYLKYATNKEEIEKIKMLILEISKNN